MSFAGIVAFKKNLDIVMDKTKDMSDGERMKIGGMLLRSSYGACSTTVKELKINDNKKAEANEL